MSSFAAFSCGTKPPTNASQISPNPVEAQASADQDLKTALACEQVKNQRETFEDRLDAVSDCLDPRRKQRATCKGAACANAQAALDGSLDDVAALERDSNAEILKWCSAARVVRTHPKWRDRCLDGWKAAYLESAARARRSANEVETAKKALELLTTAEAPDPKKLGDAENQLKAKNDQRAADDATAAQVGSEWAAVREAWAVPAYWSSAFLLTGEYSIGAAAETMLVQGMFERVRPGAFTNTEILFGAGYHRARVSYPNSPVVTLGGRTMLGRASGVSLGVEAFYFLNSGDCTGACWHTFGVRPELSLVFKRRPVEASDCLVTDVRLKMSSMFRPGDTAILFGVEFGIGTVLTRP
jgi:hypothetical protein